MMVMTLLGVGLAASAEVWAQQGGAGAPPAPAAPRPAAVSQGSVRLPEPARDATTRPAAPAAQPAAGAPPAPASGAATAPTGAAAPAAAAAAGPEGVAPVGDEMVFLNVQDQDIKDVIKQISKATRKNFIIDDKVRGKVTIMSENTMTREEAYQAFLSALEVAGFTTVVGPGGIIKVVNLKDAVSSPIPIHVDSTPYTDSFVTRLIPLKNISALDMSNAIKGLISKSGNMFAYPATNTLIITDSGTNIDRLMKIIKELDQEGPQQVLEIIPVNYAEAKAIADTVLNLFEIEKKGAPQAGKRAAGAAELVEIQDVSKIIADERTNSLIVLASKRAIDQVRDIIAKLDVPMEAADTGTIHVHYLKYANAKDLAATLSAITSGAKTAAAKAGAPAAKPGLPQQAPAAEQAVAQLSGGVSIGADDTTNALIITASAKDYKIIVDELISKLDIPRRQVYLESIVMELGVNKTKDVSINGFGGAGNNTILGLGNLGASNTLATLLQGGSAFSAPGMLGGILSQDTVTVKIPNSSGTPTEVSIPSFAAFVNAIQTYNDANIVSTPNILTLDNQKASIEVTRKIYANKITQSGTTGFQTTEPTPLEAGLTLEITPQISEGNAVRLQIHQKLSNFTAPPDSKTGAAPETKREITTTVVAMDRQTVVLGGLMEDIDTHAKTKVPILGDIPIIGWLFSSRSTAKSKNNLLVFITPHVIRDPSDFAEISKMKIEQRNRFIDTSYGKKQQKAIYDTIATHRADLLTFTPPAPPIGSEPLPPAAAVGPPVGGGGPVITVPGLGTNGLPAGVLESSAAKPSTAPPPPKTSSKSRGASAKGGSRNLLY